MLIFVLCCRRGMPAITNYLRSGLLLPPYDFSSIHLTVSCRAHAAG